MIFNIEIQIKYNIKCNFLIAKIEKYVLPDLSLYC